MEKVAKMCLSLSQNIFRFPFGSMARMPAFAAIGLALWLLGGNGGCATSRQCTSPSQWVAEYAARHERKMQYVIPCDPCYGYRPTCWNPWSDACPSCRPPWIICSEDETEKDNKNDGKVHIIPPPPLLPDGVEIVPAPKAQPAKEIKPAVSSPQKADVSVPSADQGRPSNKLGVMPASSKLKSAASLRATNQKPAVQPIAQKMPSYSPARLKREFDAMPAAFYQEAAPAAKDVLSDPQPQKSEVKYIAALEEPLESAPEPPPLVGDE
jgi:hypothetical protein